MFGIDDKFVWLAYLLCMASTLLCVVYSWANWNRGDDTVQVEDLQWEAQDRKAEEDL